VITSGVAIVGGGNSGGGGGGGGGSAIIPPASTSTNSATGVVLGASTVNVGLISTQLLGLEGQLISAEFMLASCRMEFPRNLQEGMMGTDVQNLQKALNYSYLTQVAATGPGSPGNESDYFGPATLKAVTKFQDIFADQILMPNGLTTGNGFVGSATRAELASLCAGISPAPSTSTSTSAVRASIEQ